VTVNGKKTKKNKKAGTERVIKITEQTKVKHAGRKGKKTQALAVGQTVKVKLAKNDTSTAAAIKVSKAKKNKKAAKVAKAKKKKQKIEE
jgi:hypothetical protein